MLFNSFEFLIFFPIVVGLYYILPHTKRWILLLLSSYYFYMCWKPEYVILILLSTIVDYYCAKIIYRSKKERVKKSFLMVSMLSNLSVLVFFKYFNFFGETAMAMCSSFNIFIGFEPFDYLLPVGISFYTFQTMSYTIDVYRGNSQPENHFGKFALYVSFFPQLVAGPIERASNIIPQFYKKINFNYEGVRDGILLFFWGMFKKVIIADRIAEYVNIVFENPMEYGGIISTIAVFFFGVQIYCDFSGYSDIAIGCALILGVRLMKNFKQPYFANSLKDFWSRWHISLSTWFRDYLYIPLGGNRVVKWRWYYNLFITFLVSGLWHGAAWGFIIWGAIHGIIIVLESSRYSQIPLPNILRITLTFCVVSFCWIFFRAETAEKSFDFIMSMFLSPQSAINLFQSPIDFYLSLLFIVILFVLEFINERVGIKKILWNLHAIYRWILFIMLLLILVFFGRMESQDFIYFQF